MTKEAALRNQYLNLVEKIILNEINPENGARIKYLIDHLASRPKKIKRNELLRKLVTLHRDDTATRDALDSIYLPENWWFKVLGFPYSMVGPARLANARMAVETVLKEGVPGAVIETGVWRGGASIMMKAVMSPHDVTRDLYVCDSFSGLPKIDTGPDQDLELHDNPLLTAPLEDVRSHFDRLDLLDSHVHFVEGWFSETMPQLRNKGPESISVLRLDGDYYESTIVVLRNLYDRMSQRGFVIIDDYKAFDQCRQAVDEFRTQKGIADELIDIDNMGVYWRVGG